VVINRMIADMFHEFRSGPCLFSRFIKCELFWNAKVSDKLMECCSSQRFIFHWVRFCKEVFVREKLGTRIVCYRFMFADKHVSVKLLSSQFALVIHLVSLISLT
jgi:hypothetical protein